MSCWQRETYLGRLEWVLRRNLDVDDEGSSLIARIFLNSKSVSEKPGRPEISGFGVLTGPKIVPFQ